MYWYVSTHAVRHSDESVVVDRHENDKYVYFDAHLLSIGCGLLSHSGRFDCCVQHAIQLTNTQTHTGADGEIGVGYHTV